MSELKTLKDFEFTIIDSKGNKIKRDFSDLKAEAVKWLEAARKRNGHALVQLWDYETLKRFIEHFFNLDEEVLK